MTDFITEVATSLFSDRIKCNGSSYNYYKCSTGAEILLNYKAFVVHYANIRSDNVDLVMKFVEDTAGSDDEETEDEEYEEEEEEERREEDSESDASFDSHDFGSLFAKIFASDLFQLIIGSTLFMPFMVNVSDLIASLNDQRKLEFHNCIIFDLTQRYLLEELFAKFQVLKSKITLFDDWNTDVQPPTSQNFLAAQRLSNDFIRRTRPFREFLEPSLVEVRRRTADIESRIAELDNFAKEARDQMEKIMRKSEVMHYRETECASEISEGQMARLNVRLSMIDAETRNMTKKEKKDRKEVLKKLKENAVALRQRIARLPDQPPEGLKKNEKRLNVEYFLLVRQSEEAIPALGLRGWFTESAAAKGVTVKPFFQFFDKLIESFDLRKKHSASPALGSRGRKLVVEAEERFEMNGNAFIFEEFNSNKGKLRWENDEFRMYPSEPLEKGIESDSIEKGIETEPVEKGIESEPVEKGIETEPVEKLIDVEDAIDSLQISDGTSPENLPTLQNTLSMTAIEPSVAYHGPLTAPNSQTTTISPKSTTTEPSVASQGTARNWQATAISPTAIEPIVDSKTQTTTILPTDPSVASLLTTSNSRSTTSAKMRQCANEGCGQIEAIPQSFGICELCRNSRRLQGRPRRHYPRSFYCSVKCLRADWTARHRECHELRSEEDESVDSEIDSNENIELGICRGRLDSVD